MLSCCDWKASELGQPHLGKDCRHCCCLQTSCSHAPGAAWTRVLQQAEAQALACTGPRHEQAAALAESHLEAQQLPVPAPLPMSSLSRALRAGWLRQLLACSICCSVAQLGCWALAAASRAGQTQSVGNVNKGHELRHVPAQYEQAASRQAEACTRACEEEAQSKLIAHSSCRKYPAACQGACWTQHLCAHRQEQKGGVFSQQSRATPGATDRELLGLDQQISQNPTLGCEPARCSRSGWQSAVTVQLLRRLWCMATKVSALIMLQNSPFWLITPPEAVPGLAQTQHADCKTPEAFCHPPLRAGWHPQSRQA